MSDDLALGRPRAGRGDDRPALVAPSPPGGGAQRRAPIEIHERERRTWRQAAARCVQFACGLRVRVAVAPAGSLLGELLLVEAEDLEMLAGEFRARADGGVRARAAGD
jgi:hypothetical protein